MFKNNFKIILRNLWRNKTYGFLNIFGLAIGIACAGLIFLWVEDEINFDGFNTNKDRLYFVRVNANFDAGIYTHWSTPGALAPAMEQEIPGIANTCRTTEGKTSILIGIGDKSIFALGNYVEPSMFNMFTLPFVQGDARTAFAQLHSLVITETTARKLFPLNPAKGKDQYIIGKTVRIDNKQDYVITGVLKDLPQNSSLQFEWVAPFQIWYQQNPWAQVWNGNFVATYVELKPGTDPAQINSQLYNFVQKKVPTSIDHVFLYSMNDWHLYDQFENGKKTGGGRIEYVHLFTLIAWIILIIACINFMNLATARSEKRAREVGVRKVLGAEKKSLVMQFIGEALFMAMLATVLALAIMLLASNPFNTLVHKNLSLELGNPLHLSVLIITMIICGLIAGSYPSFYLSSFNPAYVLKGTKLKSGTASIIRKSLVILQFSVSIVLIISTIIIYQQIQHVKDRNLGFNKNNLIEINAQGDMSRNFHLIRQDLIQRGITDHVALADHTIIDGGNNVDYITWQGKAPGKIRVSWRDVTADFFTTAGMKILEGRNFESTDSANFYDLPIKANVIITQSLAKLMDNESALGKLVLDENGTLLRTTVIGVVNDYVYGNMYGKPDPVLFFCAAPRILNTMYLRTKPGTQLEPALNEIEAVLKKDNPGYPIEYKFVDDQFNEMFLSEILISKLSSWFAVLAVMISCLGLFGLASYTAERRTKEIGIRKVLGASVSGIAALLSKYFLKLVFISSVIAFPVSWWAMHSWLQKYEYRISIQWWIFIVAGAMALSIAFITISFQTIKAGLSNPANSLRNE